jgi:RNA polymerase sigma factor (sigma-70 family)
MAKIPDSQLVKELKDGNPAGCRHLIDSYQDRLLHEAVNVFDLPLEDGEELVSDVLLTVVQRVGDFEFKKTEKDFLFWLLTIFRNRVRDHLRRCALTEGIVERFQESATEDEEQYTGAEQEVVREIVRQYEEALRRDNEDADGRERHSSRALKAVIDMLERLEPWERVLLRCRAMEVPYEDIASYTDKPVRQLKVYHARVRKKFVRMLIRHSPEFAHQLSKAIDL